jgi:hypothetical protein
MLIVDETADEKFPGTAGAARQYSRTARLSVGRK